MTGVRLIAATGRKFSTASVHPKQFHEPALEYVEMWCKEDAAKLFRWLGDNLPTATYHELRHLIYEEILKDSE